MVVDGGVGVVVCTGAGADTGAGAGSGMGSGAGSGTGSGTSSDAAGCGGSGGGARSPIAGEYISDSLTGLLHQSSSPAERGVLVERKDKPLRPCGGYTA